MNATPEQIKFCAQWLLTHSTYWDESSAQVASVQGAAAAVTIRPEAWEWPGLAGLKASYESLTGDTIQTALSEGVSCSATTGQLLHDSAVAYINTESQNEQLSGQIRQELGL